MPIYEYQCDQCQKYFEQLQGIKEKPLRKCIHCGGPVHRLISQTSFALKGAGWYRDGYSSSSGKADSKASSESKAPSTPASPKKESNSAKSET